MIAAFPLRWFPASLVALVLCPVLAWCQEADSAFHRGYYLEHEAKDVAGALQAYQSVLQDRSATKRGKELAVERIASLREEQAAEDLAGLLPEDTVLFVELNRPARHLENLARMMGLVDRARSGNGDKVTIELEDGFALPSDFQISPALLGELKKIRGVAAGINRVSRQGEPCGVAVIHPGQSDIVRGLIETGIQVIPQEESIDGFDAYCVEDKIWIVRTKRLFIVSPDRKAVEETVARLRDPGLPSLAKRAAFQECRTEREDAALFVCLDGKQAIRTFDHLLQGEARMARIVLDLDHVRRATAALATTDRAARARIQLALDKDHNNLLYGLIRTVPLSRRALEHMPAGAALVATVGVNPKIAGRAAPGRAAGQLTALDLGRELFANIEELGVFLLPTLTAGSDEVPDFGIVIAANDAEKSTLLWNQLLSLPASLDVEHGPSAKDISLAGRNARQYTFPDEKAPVLVITQLDEKTMVVGTRGAVEAAIGAGQNSSLATDEQFQQLLADLPDRASKAILAHVGRIMQLGGQLEKGPDAKKLQVMSHVFDRLKVTLVSDERPSQLTIQLQVTGLPQFENVIRVVSAMRAQENQEDVQVVSHSDDETGK